MPMTYCCLTLQEVVRALEEAKELREQLDELNSKCSDQVIYDQSSLYIWHFASIIRLQGRAFEALFIARVCCKTLLSPRRLIYFSSSWRGHLIEGDLLERGLISISK